MNKREIKESCYKDILADITVNVTNIINQINNIESKEGTFSNDILQKDIQRTFFDLEITLAELCIMLRKMDENDFINLPLNLRRDINSVIHSNKFEYHSLDLIYCYSKKGKEDISIKQLLKYTKNII
ncbi:MAG: hypothetical protein PHH04_01855 [Thomasclavelia sp.]|nr:hypothetical protein [Thomasclavelia sp.]